MRIVVGGESRKAGKTTLICRIVAAFPEAGWTVVKMTPHLHGGGEAAWTLVEDAAAGDTARYSAAGARRTLLYCGDSSAGLRQLVAELDKAENWIVETTSAAALIAHDLAILVKAREGAAVKASARGFPAGRLRMSPDEAALESIVRGSWKK
jgi:hypothetical protein